MSAWPFSVGPLPRRPYLRLAERLLGVPDARLDGGLRGPLPSAGRRSRAIADDLLTVLFPSTGRVRRPGPTRDRTCCETLAGHLAALERRLEEAVFLGLHRRCREDGASDDCRRQAQGRSPAGCWRRCPTSAALLVKDVEAALEGDPGRHAAPTR